MTEDVKKLVESVEVYSKIAEPNGSYVLKSEFLRVVKELTKWNKVEDGLPKFGKTINVRFTDIKGEILECSAKLENIPRYCGKDAPIDKRWFVYPSSGHELTGRVTEWKYIN